ncbi:hypothetical protein [Streptomyces sp. NPDC054866]
MEDISVPPFSTIFPFLTVNCSMNRVSSPVATSAMVRCTVTLYDSAQRSPDCRVGWAGASGRSGEAREIQDRSRIARETVSDVMAEMSTDASVAMDAEPEAIGPDETEELPAYAGTERHMVGVVAIPGGRRSRYP